MSVFKRNPRYLFTLGALSMAAALAACGGSDDPVDTGGGAAGVAVVVLPAVGESTGVTDTGVTDAVDLNYLVFSPDGSTRVVPAAVSYTSPTGSLTLLEAAGDLLVSTVNDWADVVWPTGLTGLLKINGNAGLICDTTDNSGQVGVSGNMVQVTDLAELRGKTFQYNECAGAAVLASDLFTFRDDGSALIDEGADADFAISAAEVAAYFSDAGWLIDGGIFKGRVFAHTPSGGQKQYVIVDISDDVGDGSARVKTVALFTEVVAPR